jgi:hypothetical protein
MRRGTRSPHEVLGLAPGASAEEIRTARRNLARTHHPDNFSGDTAGARKATREMALINAAVEALLAEVWATEDPAMTPPPRGGHRPEAPVTGRVEFTQPPQFNARTSEPTRVSWRPEAEWPARPTAELRSSRVGTPAGPVRRRVDPKVAARPRISLEAARAVRFTFGRYAGATVDAVGRRDPGYLAWCVDNVRRDPELAQAADRVLDHLANEYGVTRPARGSLFRPSPVAFDGGAD